MGGRKPDPVWWYYLKIKEEKVFRVKCKYCGQERYPAVDKMRSHIINCASFLKQVQDDHQNGVKDSSDKGSNNNRKFDISICLNETDIILDEVKIEPSENLNSFHTFDAQLRNAIIHRIKNNQPLETTSDKHYECLNCCKSFKNEKGLHKHAKRHLNVRKYVCKTCSKSFFTSKELNKHIQIHTNVRIHECSICCKCFKTRAVLIQHMKFHSADKMFKCEICSKSFKLKQHLIQHKPAHSDVKNYECKICSKSYKFRHNLKNHLKIHSKLGEIKQEILNVEEKINDKCQFKGIGNNIRIKLEMDDE